MGFDAFPQQRDAFRVVRACVLGVERVYEFLGLAFLAEHARRSLQQKLNSRPVLLAFHRSPLLGDGQSQCLLSGFNHGDSGQPVIGQPEDVQAIAVVDLGFWIVNANMPLTLRSHHVADLLRRLNDDRPLAWLHDDKLFRLAATIADDCRPTVAVQQCVMLDCLAKRGRSH